MKINVYEINLETESQGKLLGVVHYNAQRLTIDSPYKIIEDIVNNAYQNAVNGNGNGKHYKKMKLHQFNTSDFVESLGVETWKNGLMIEIAE